MKNLIVLKGRVIDGKGGEVIEKGVVVVSGSRILTVCKEAEWSEQDGAVIIQVEDGTIMPGFIDQHVHIGMGSIKHIDLYSMHPYEKVCHAIRDLENLLNAGFTTVRDCGGVGNHLKNALEQGLIEGPRLFCAGRTLTQTNGHFDQIKSFPIEFNEKGNILAYIADGITEVRKAARMNFREKADFLKCMLSPGTVSEGKSIDTQEYSDEEIKAIVEEADKLGTYVAAHCISNKGIKAAIRCGVQSIEHAFLLDEVDAEKMAKKGLWMFPTLSITERFIKNIANKTNQHKIPYWLEAKVSKVYGRQAQSLNLARKMGVKVGFGTDFVGDADVCRHGENGMEFGLLCQRGGYGPMEAICMATKFGSEVVMEPDLGTLEQDKLADIVVAQGNPLENIDLLASADNIKLVMKGGDIKKQIA